ncbi:MAG: M67 family metallopeptidase [Ignavibacteria bacterium]|nr:M67 family metallopeptidase [Ignavibacteria bacterium]MBI3764919.1 M67 family metallopeptidase [Ignavibacteriales bacterium]
MIRIPKHIEHEIRYHGEKSYPEEGCGLLLGTSRDGIFHVHEVIQVPNAQDVDRDRRFLITSDQYREAESIAREKNLELLGVYHSHPDHQAQPSQYDLERALPSFIYVIISVIGKRADNVTGWVLSESGRRFDEQTIHIVI